MRCSKCIPGRPCLSHTPMPFGKFKNLTFDDIPLGYLDWLAAQKWLYGMFETRLYAYLKHPCIQRELDQEFASVDAWGNHLDVREVFVPSQQTSKRFNYGKPQFIDPEADAEEEKEQRRLRARIRGVRRYTTQGAWNMAITLLERFDKADAEELYQLAAKVTQPLKDALPDHVIAALREAFNRRRAQLVIEAQIDHKEDALELLEAIREDPSLEPIARTEAPDLLAQAEMLELMGEDHAQHALRFPRAKARCKFVKQAV